MDKSVNLTCHQSDIFKREQFFELFNERYLRIVKKSKKGKKEFVVELISLLPDSIRVLKIAWHWLAATCGFLLLSAGIIYYLEQHFSLKLALYLIPACLVTSLLTAGTVYLLLLKSERNQVFYTAYANFPIIKMMVNQPNKRDFDKFVNELNKNINAELEKNTISVKNLQAGEMKMLRRLCTAGILSHHEYDKAKTKIFNYIDSQDAEQVALGDEIE